MCESSVTTYGVLSVNLALTRTSGAALTYGMSQVPSAERITTAGIPAAQPLVCSSSHEASSASDPATSQTHFSSPSKRGNGTCVSEVCADHTVSRALHAAYAGTAGGDADFVDASFLARAMCEDEEPVAKRAKVIHSPFGAA